MSNLKELYDDDGNPISPILTNGKKNYLIDIDGTICDDCPNEEPELMVTAKPYLDARDKINEWYEKGHIITFFSARTDEHRGITVKWLSKHGFKYHFLLLNKPRGGNYHVIDNHIVRATRYEGNFGNFRREMQEIEVFE